MKTDRLSCPPSEPVVGVSLATLLPYVMASSWSWLSVRFWGIRTLPPVPLVRARWIDEGARFDGVLVSASIFLRRLSG